MENIVDKLIYTLNLINVHGVDDMSRMLGCIQTLQKMKESIDESEVVCKDDKDYKSDK